VSKKIIKFINTTNLELEPPKPAKNYIPEWFKETTPYIGDKNEYSKTTRATIKKCLPVFDAITSGYLFLTPVDFWITIEDGIPYYYWKSESIHQFAPIHFQAANQAEKHPFQKNHPWKDVPKIINPWSIQTPKGYSCLILPPMHRETPFNIFPAIVDTDSYKAPVNFPFVLFNQNLTGLIPAGTPVAQIIPFKRESWESESSTDSESSLRQLHFISTFFYNAYRNHMWSRKEFK